MASKKQQPVQDDDADFLDGDSASTAENPESEDSDELAGLEKELDSVWAEGADGDIAHCARSGDTASRRLATKRRLDAYLERKWFRELGWDEDDDLFDDEFFKEDVSRPSHHR